MLIKNFGLLGKEGRRIHDINGVKLFCNGNADFGVHMFVADSYS